MYGHFINFCTTDISDHSLYHQQIFTEFQTLFWGYDSESIKWMEKLFTKMVKREEPIQLVLFKMPSIVGLKTTLCHLNVVSQACSKSLGIFLDRLKVAWMKESYQVICMIWTGLLLPFQTPVSTLEKLQMPLKTSEFLPLPIISKKMPQSYRYSREQRTHIQGSIEMHPFLTVLRLTNQMVVESVASLA